MIEVADGFCQPEGRFIAPGVALAYQLQELRQALLGGVHQNGSIVSGVYCCAVGWPLLLTVHVRSLSRF